MYYKSKIRWGKERSRRAKRYMDENKIISQLNFRIESYEVGCEG
jgi:hypothetical protein